MGRTIGVRSGYEVSALGVALLGFAATLAIAADQIRTERVNFARGASSAVVKGQITGYETVDYLLGAAKGQRMTVSMKTDTGSNYFNLLAPGESEVAFFIGSTEGNRYEGVLPASGDFKIRVYLMRSDARRNKTANYTLQVAITGAPQGAARDGGGTATRASAPAKRATST